MNIRVVDVPTESTAAQAEELLNAVCSQGYRVRLMMPANKGACTRVLFELRKPEHAPVSRKGAIGEMSRRAYVVFNPGEPVTYRPELGSESTYYRWLKLAKERGLLMKSKGEWRLAPKTEHEGGEA